MHGSQTTLDFIQDLIAAGIPVVDMTIDHREIEIPRVSGDHARCGRLAARVLTACQESDIAAHLTAAFRKALGTTPSTFRKQHAR